MKITLALLLALATAPDDDVSVRLTVANFYKTADGKMWSSGSWELTFKKGDDVAKARLVLEPQGKTGERRDWKGEVSLKELDKAVVELKRKGLFTAKDPVPCACDAPRFKMVAKEGRVEHAFNFGHDHPNQDQLQKALVDAFIRFIESHVTELK